MPTTQRSFTPSAARLPLKDALRMLRFTMKRGRGFLDTPLDPIPSPISDVARSVLRDFDQIADRVNDMAAGLSRRFLDSGGGESLSTATLEDIEHIGHAEIAFAQAAYHGLTRALPHLGASEGLVSEVRSAEAYKAAIQSGAAEKDRFALAAALMQEMVDRGVIRDLLPAAREEEGEPLTEEELEKLAIFALILWFLAERQDGPEDAEALLLTCCDMAEALKTEVTECLGDAERLRALLSAYADKI
ncbi:hypothetical protein [Pelagibius sp.]|uniref:hypothetical protein n=1 Tax=Pelagibius sp. TaxID=1931238 RepID=UPI00262FAB17|nr:hypothetical protein [Pelagibius sp.]